MMVPVEEVPVEQDPLAAAQVVLLIMEQLMVALASNFLQYSIFQHQHQVQLAVDWVCPDLEEDNIGLQVEEVEVVDQQLLLLVEELADLMPVAVIPIYLLEILVFKIPAVVEEVVNGLLQSVAATVVPESSSLLILHKYSKNIQWA